MLQHFLGLKVAYNCAINQDLVLFNNKEILIENQTIFYKEWFQKGKFLVQDFLHENGQLLTFQEFIQRYDVECNFLKCMQVVSAIPKHLDKARECLYKHYVREWTPHCMYMDTVFTGISVAALI